MKIQSFVSAFGRALAYAEATHRLQRRKNTTIPYIGQLLSVASLVIDAGGTEEEAIAALLHDSADDQGGEPRLLDIEREFGLGVAAIVKACSESFVSTPKDKEDWVTRKLAYLEHLEKEGSASVLLVSVCEKTHTLRSMLTDYRDDEVGELLWSRFNKQAGKVGSIRYYRSLRATFLSCTESGVNRIAKALAETLNELENACNAAKNPDLADPKIGLDESYREVLARQDADFVVVHPCKSECLDIDVSPGFQPCPIMLPRETEKQSHNIENQSAQNLLHEGQRVKRDWPTIWNSVVAIGTILGAFATVTAAIFAWNAFRVSVEAAADGKEAIQATYQQLGLELNAVPTLSCSSVPELHADATEILYDDEKVRTLTESESQRFNPKNAIGCTLRNVGRYPILQLTIRIHAETNDPTHQLPQCLRWGFDVQGVGAGASTRFNVISKFGDVMIAYFDTEGTMIVPALSGSVAQKYHMLPMPFYSVSLKNPDARVPTVQPTPNFSCDENSSK